MVCHIKFCFFKNWGFWNGYSLFVINLQIAQTCDFFDWNDEIEKNEDVANKAMIDVVALAKEILEEGKKKQAEILEEGK